MNEPGNIQDLTDQIMGFINHPSISPGPIIAKIKIWDNLTVIGSYLLKEQRASFEFQFIDSEDERFEMLYKLVERLVNAGESFITLYKMRFPYYKLIWEIKIK